MFEEGDNQVGWGGGVFALGANLKEATRGLGRATGEKKDFSDGTKPVRPPCTMLK